MTCTTCGEPLPEGAKFCANCGTRVDPPAETVEMDATDELGDPGDTGDPGDPDAAATAVTAVVVDPGPVEPSSQPRTPAAASMPDVTPAPRRRRTFEEHGTFEEFRAAIVPVLRAPRVTANLLAALIALAISIAVSVVLWLLLDHAFPDHADVLLPPGVDPGQDQVGIVSLLTSVLHQVPLRTDGGMYAAAPFLLALLPLLACAVGLRLARRAMPCSARGGFLVRNAPFAAAYAVLLFIWSLFSAQEWNGSHLRSLVYGAAFALLGAVVHDRLLAADDSAATSTTAARPVGAAATASRPRRALRTAARVFVLTLAVASLGGLVVHTIEAVHDDHDDRTGTTVADGVLQVVEGGFAELGFGVLAEANTSTRDDDGVRVWDTHGELSTAGFIVALVTAFGAVIVGGLYSGFAVARTVHPRSRNDHALYGAVTGVVWSLAMFVAQFFVLTRLGDDDTTYTEFDGVEMCFLALLVGGVLGALGGLLAATVVHGPDHPDHPDHPERFDHPVGTAPAVVTP
ncbi:MAG: hypothetical protein JWM98_3390 [Thermoleophilia bacterium]|nr:hypothetical protein [Thermoleophilia bacterium]